MLSLFFLSAAIVLRGTVAQSPSALTNVSQAFSSASVVPDVLDSFTPTALLNVIFTDPATMQALNITPGMNLSTEGQSRRISTSSRLPQFRYK